MKIGILTFHFVHNYGAVLQAYALQEFLRSNKYDVEFINFRPYERLFHEFRRFYIRRFISRNLKRVIYQLLLIPKRELRWKNFERFINENLKMSPKVKEIPSSYDVYVFGSDQIWNPFITNGFIDSYFGIFPFPKEHRKYISYAPSMCQDHMTKSMEDYLKGALANFDSISVREHSAVSLLIGLTSKPIAEVLDPTLLVQPSVWKSKIKNRNHSKKYVLVYQVVPIPETMNIANVVAKQQHAEVIEIKPYVELKNRKNVMTTLSPDRFLDLIANACYVVTTSFHGTVFSLIYNIPFYTIKHNDSRDSRVISLLGALGIEERLISRTTLPVCKHVNYDTINEKLETLRSFSQSWLLDSLKDK